jgi:hypothetical protein
MINLHGHEPFCDIRAGRSVKCNCVASTYIEEIESLREKLDLAVEALNWIYATDSKTHKDGSVEVWGCGEKARHALAKIEETEK